MIALCFLAIWEPIVTKKGEMVGDGPTREVRTLLRTLDGLGLALALFDLWLQERYYGLKSAKRAWIVAKLIVILALFANWLASLQGYPYWTRALRPILLLERLRNVRKVTGNIVRSAPDIFNAGALLLIVHCFFAVLGVVLFQGIGFKEGPPGPPDPTDFTRGYGEDEPDNLIKSCVVNRTDPMPDPLGCTAFWDEGCKFFFNSIDECSIQLLALLTGAANFPTFMIPVYQCNQANSLYFIFYYVSLITALLAGPMSPEL